MMDCLVFLNGHLLKEIHSYGEWEAVSRYSIETDPAFSYTNQYHWLYGADGYTLLFTEILHTKDRVDLVNPRSTGRKTVIVKDEKYELELGLG